MQPSVFTNDNSTDYYTDAIEALCKIAATSFYRGKFEETFHVLYLSLPLLEASDVAQKARLALLLLYGRVLTVGHLIKRSGTDRLFSVLLQARQIATSIQDQPGLATALSLLGQAHCNVVTVAALKRGVLPFGQRGEDGYEEALVYQQQALGLRETVQDTQGISESHFCIGLIHQFWQQNETARDHFTRAIQVAEHYGHVLEQAEPHRHLAVDALFAGDLNQALFHALQALSFREAGGFRPYQPLDHLMLRDIFLGRGEMDKAQFHLQQATTLAQEMELSALVASALDSTRSLGQRESGE